ncbi:hypothetical protein PQX77_020402 [Marasmius sp. AFHP31]|nr:hypothetical protein PQX77_020402 [Marasmius sp. AFHP31]
MPAHRLHKSKKDREQATRDKNKKYYERNQDNIRGKRRERHVQQTKVERKARKAIVEKEKQAFWEEQAHREYQRNTLEELRTLEKNVNQYLSNSGSTYLKRIYHEYLAWMESDPRQSSPLEAPNVAFNSMLDAVGKIGNGILNEYGAGKEWKQCQRFTKRIRYLLQCVANIEMVYLEQQDRASSVLEEAYTKRKLLFQDDSTGQWLDRLECRVYNSALDKHTFL